MEKLGFDDLENVNGGVGGVTGPAFESVGGNSSWECSLCGASGKNSSDGCYMNFQKHNDEKHKDEINLPCGNIFCKHDCPANIHKRQN